MAHKNPAFAPAYQLENGAQVSLWSSRTESEHLPTCHRSPFDGLDVSDTLHAVRTSSLVGEQGAHTEMIEWLTLKVIRTLYSYKRICLLLFLILYSLVLYAFFDRYRVLLQIRDLLRIAQLEDNLLARGESLGREFQGKDSNLEIRKESGDGLNG